MSCDAGQFYMSPKPPTVCMINQANITNILKTWNEYFWTEVQGDIFPLLHPCLGIVGIIKYSKWRDYKLKNGIWYERFLSTVCCFQFFCKEKKVWRNLVPIMSYQQLEPLTKTFYLNLDPT